MSAHRLIVENTGLLRQAVSLLQQLNDDQFRRHDPAKYPSCIGKHIRHCVDHYDKFIAGLDAGKINYDERPRDTSVEIDRRVAIVRLQQLGEALQHIPKAVLSDTVFINSNESEHNNCSANWNVSSVARELQFLISHTVHHYALVAMMLRLQNVEVDSEFGFAQSTIKHERSRKLCAQ